MITPWPRKREGTMDESYSRFGESRQPMVPLRDSEGRIEYLLKAEGQILQSVSARAPVSEILNDICVALDCQIGNMVSLFCLRGNDAIDAFELARHAGLFGLFIFVSVGIFAESGEELGSLEMYSCEPRYPSPCELRVIDRAVCLAAIAIDRDLAFGHPPYWRVSANRTSRANVLKWPVSPN
jgi:hypothetical protein